MVWIAPKIWESEEVWILGGGPSLTKQFEIPNEIVDKVVKGELKPSAYSSYLSPIHNKHIIGVNVSFLIGDFVDIVYFGDIGFFLRYEQLLAEFKGLRVSNHKDMRSVPWVKYLQNDSKRVRGLTSKPDKISWNYNSGAAAINLAANMGAKRIILVGFDMKLDETKKQHWHNLYGKMSNPNVKRPQLNFPVHLASFQEISKDAKLRGIEIINACPDSAIKELPKATVKSLL